LFYSKEKKSFFTSNFELHLLSLIFAEKLRKKKEKLRNYPIFSKNYRLCKNDKFTSHDNKKDFISKGL